DKVVARSRSLESLQARHAGVSQQEYARQSQLTTGARAWEFGTLPAQQETGSGPRRQIGYPALVDEGGTVGLRVFATPPEARASHLLGTVRLIRLVMAREFKSMRRDLAVNVQAEIVYRGLPAHPLHPGLGTGRDLRDDLLDRVIAAVFLEDRDALRDEAAFQARLAGS